MMPVEITTIRPEINTLYEALQYMHDTYVGRPDTCDGRIEMQSDWDSIAWDLYIRGLIDNQTVSEWEAWVQPIFKTPVFPNGPT